jgi:hypothetical protein
MSSQLFDVWTVEARLTSQGGNLEREIKKGIYEISFPSQNMQDGADGRDTKIDFVSMVCRLSQISSDRRECLSSMKSIETTAINSGKIFQEGQVNSPHN